MGGEILLSQLEGFEWDEGNRKKNKRKHEVEWWEGEEIFFNRPLIVNFDEKHSTKREKRFQAMGKTNWGRGLLVSFTIRKKKIRIISARDQSKKERSKYAKYEKL